MHLISRTSTRNICAPWELDEVGRGFWARAVRSRLAPRGRVDGRGGRAVAGRVSTACVQCFEIAHTADHRAWPGARRGGAPG